jgi:ligand-binding sensor domain-containing protein
MQLKNYVAFFCLFNLLLFFQVQAFAQIAGYKSYILNEGVLPEKIFSLFKNDKGYLFVGSNRGLYKFDGKKFRKIETKNPGLEDTVTAIFQDADKQIWTGYQSGRIAKITAGKIQYLSPEEGTPKKRVTAFVQDKKKNIFFSTRGEGIYYFRNKRMYLINADDGLSDLNVYAMSVADNGDIIAATDQGINICSINGEKKGVTVLGPKEGLPDYIVTCIAPAGNNSFWIGMQDKGICLYNHATKRITVPSFVTNWNKGQVNALLYSHNNLWITTQDSGLVAISVSQSKFLNMPPLLNQQKGISNIEQDDQGNIWLASENNTLTRIAGNSLNLLTLYDQQLSATIHAVLVDNLNNYWVGTQMALIKFYSKGSGFATQKYRIDGLDIKTDITSLYQDKYHNIWIGTMGKGIHVLNTETGKSRQLDEVVTRGSNSILSITGNESTVCAAGLEGALVFELTDQNKSINSQYYFTVYNNIKNVGSIYIYNVFKDSKKRTWFATDGKGLTMLVNGVFTNYNNTNGIKDNHIYSITEDKKGNIWFSTSNAGVYSFDGNTFVNYSIKEGLRDLTLSVIKTDKEGNIVVVHKEGLDIIEPETGKIFYINSVQNTPIITDDLGAICTDSSGNIFVSTTKGILQYSALSGVRNYPKTIIETVELFLNEMDTSSSHLFNYDENNITFNFAGLYYSNPENIIYRYKLEGLDSVWQFTNDDSKSFPKLAPGKYRFRVQSSVNKSFVAASEDSFEFEIKKPIWKEWWFITATLSLAVGVLYWYIKKRETHLKHVERLQGEKIKFEFEVLRNQVNPHFLFNSFNTLISTIEEDPAMAIEYVEQLADFFRNIVNYGDKDIIALQEEIVMMENYLYLQQKRYGNNLQLQIDISEYEKQAFFLPPLTLQLLVENAIKHNVVSKEAKLHITLQIQNGYIVIQNNINEKIASEKGMGMGLQNIKNRYALLNKKPVLIENSGNLFTVRLPILTKA